MKTIIISLLSLGFGFGCNNGESKNVPKAESEIKDTVTINENKQDSITENKPSKESLDQYFIKDGEWIQIKNALSADQTGIYVYFQAPEDVARNLRMRIQYGNESVFEYVIDGKSYSYRSNRSKDSDNRFAEGSSLKWYDSDVKNKDYKFLQALSNSKNAKVVFSDGSSITISEAIKSGIKRTFDYFESLDGLLPKTNMVNIRR